MEAVGSGFVPEALEEVVGAPLEQLARLQEVVDLIEVLDATVADPLRLDALRS